MQLAHVLKVDFTTIFSWETDRRFPRAKHALQIAKLSELDLESFNTLYKDELPVRKKRLVKPKQEKPKQEKPKQKKPEKPAFKSAKLKRLRLKLRLTQAQMADILGVSHSRYNAWEYGKTSPGMDSRQEIVKLFGKTRQEIFTLYKEKLVELP